MEWRFGGTADLGGPALSAGGRGTGAPDIREGGRCFLVSSGGGPPLPPGRRLLGGPEIEYGRYGGFADGPGPGAPSEPGARPATRPGGLGGVATGGPDMARQCRAARWMAACYSSCRLHTRTYAWGIRQREWARWSISARTMWRARGRLGRCSGHRWACKRSSAWCRRRVLASKQPTGRSGHRGWT
jgi:hypothetical protein